MLTDSTSAWIDGYLRPRYPELVPLYVEACSILSSVRESGRLTEGQANRLFELASSPRTPLGENVAGMLGDLAGNFSEAQNIVARLSDAGQVHCRINALVALDSFHVGPLHARLISALLCDKSMKVRALASSKAMSFGMSELVPDLDRAIEKETNEKLRTELEWNRTLLRDGYLVRGQPNGTVWVTCKQGGGVVSRSFPEAQFESEGRKWIAEQRR